MQSSNHLLAIIEDLIDIAAIESGHKKISEDTFSLLEFVNSVIEIMNIQIKEKGLELKIDIPDIIVKTDKAKFRQILFNILSNSCKFTDKGKIEIKAEIINNEIIFAIHDTGIGIDKSQINMIFDSFYQVSTGYKRKFGGLGLGLAISKRLVESLNGNIWVESKINKGSSFYFIIKKY